MRARYFIKVKKLFFFGFLIFKTACTHSIHMVHVSDFSPTFKSKQDGRIVNSQAEQSVILGFVTETQFVNIALNRLMEQCQGGTLQGITTEYLTSHGFFSWTNQIQMKALCIK